MKTCVFTLLFVVVAINSPLAKGEVPEKIQSVYTELESVFQKHYPEAKCSLDADNAEMRFAFDTRIFLIHHANKAGLWQEAREERGPNRKGIYCEISWHEGEYRGAFITPQLLEGPYFDTWLLTPYSATTGKYLHVRLHHTPKMDPAFLQEFLAALEDYAPLGKIPGLPPQ